LQARSESKVCFAMLALVSHSTRIAPPRLADNLISSTRP
jgi:hypothetical protein